LVMALSNSSADKLVLVCAVHENKNSVKEDTYNSFLKVFIKNICCKITLLIL
jgi:hypothetical protein